MANKIFKIGYIQAYNEADFIGYQIDNALKFCDLIYICEGSQFAAYPEIPERSNDWTMDIILDKIKEHPNRIRLYHTVRKHKNYRKNQCCNWNIALEYCKDNFLKQYKNVYFVGLDADEIWFDLAIKKMVDIMDNDQPDLIKFFGKEFAFSFDWQLIIHNNPKKRAFIFKVNPDMYFKPTHNAKNVGKNHIILNEDTYFHHYKWVKPVERMSIRHKTSGFVPGMMRWFKDHWENIPLENKTHNFYLGKFSLKKFEGKHPEVLDNHPLRNIKDIRKI